MEVTLLNLRTELLSTILKVSVDSGDVFTFYSKWRFDA